MRDPKYNKIPITGGNPNYPAYDNQGNKIDCWSDTNIDGENTNNTSQMSGNSGPQNSYQFINRDALISAEFNQPTLGEIWGKLTARGTGAPTLTNTNMDYTTTGLIQAKEILDKYPNHKIVYASVIDVADTLIMAATMGASLTLGKALFNGFKEEGPKFAKTLVKNWLGDYYPGNIKSAPPKTYTLPGDVDILNSAPKGVSNPKYKSLRDLMSPEEATRYDNYWKQGAGSYENIKLPDGSKIEVIKNGNILSTRQRLQAPPGTRSIVDVKYSGDGSMYYRETIFDEYGRRIGNNDYTNHGRTDHTNPHYHPNSYERPDQHGDRIPGLHPETP